MAESGRELTLYHGLQVLREIVGSYPEAEEAYGRKLSRLIERLEGESYRVAVIGEFKRGKSSMINALLGVEVLPTDILPMTAVINRIVYAPEKGAAVYFKDGREEKIPLDELERYVTKQDAEKARMAEQVREVEIRYPSVFCKNQIELLDTPGLNDDEQMTETTLGVLEKIDAAIVVLSAVLPLSMTERGLIEKLLKSPEIGRIVFVVTFLDAVSSRREEQDRAVEFIQNRLSGDTLREIEERYREEPELVEKARRVLERPAIFPVSSTLAIKGFLRDDENLLEKSRFPALKYGLTELLTAAQSADLRERAERLEREIDGALRGWYQARRERLEGKQAEREKALEACRTYLDTAWMGLEELLVKADAALLEAGLDPEKGLKSALLEEQLRRDFIVQLSALHLRDDTDAAIGAALERGAEDGRRELEAVTAWASAEIDRVMERCAGDFLSLRAESCLSQAGRLWEDPLPQGRIPPPKEGPAFSWPEELWPAGVPLAGAEVMPRLEGVIAASLEPVREGCRRRMAAWRAAMFRQIEEDKLWLSRLEDRREESGRKHRLELELCRAEFEKHREKLGARL